ncbi:hypothetical protein ACR9PC_004440, partial [Vibrio vulnificus]
QEGKKRESNNNFVPFHRQKPPTGIKHAILIVSVWFRTLYQALYKKRARLYGAHPLIISDKNNNKIPKPRGTTYRRQ